MTWCVCSDKDGNLTLMSRPTREAMLRWWSLVKVVPPTFVVKTFEDIGDAETYMDEMKLVNKLINDL